MPVPEPARSQVGALGGLQTDLAIGSTHRKPDLAMIGRAVREGWAVPEAKRVDIVDRLVSLVAKTHVEVMTQEGPVALDGPADANAISAARVLVAMTGQNQADRHHQDEQALSGARLALDAAQALAQLGDDDKRRIIEQAGLSHLLPPGLAPVAPQVAPVLPPDQPKP